MRTGLDTESSPIRPEAGAAPAGFCRCETNGSTTIKKGA